jgi:hypothetical protein
MSVAFGFFLRLFGCFVAAKLFLHAVGVESREYLIGLSAVLTANVYWLRYLVFRDRGSFSMPETRVEKQAAAEARPGDPPLSG